MKDMYILLAAGLACICIFLFVAMLRINRQFHKMQRMWIDECDRSNTLGARIFILKCENEELRTKIELMKSEKYSKKREQLIREFKERNNIK